MHDYRFFREENLLVDTELSNADKFEQTNQNGVLLSRGKVLLLMFIAFFIGAVIAGIAVFGIISSTKSKSYSRGAQHAERSSDLQRENEQLECKWTVWSPWTDCSMTCGNGTQLRMKQQFGNVSNCQRNATIQSQPCFSDECPDDERWLLWNPWTDCSVTCGNGTQYRYRQRNGTTSDIECNQKETKNCLTGECKNDFEIDLSLDPTTIHQKWFISDDSKVISNTYTTRTPNSPDGHIKQLQKYKGAIADVCVRPNEVIYFTVKYDLDLTVLLERYWLLFEVGLAELNKIDKSHYIGSSSVNGWSFDALNYPKFNEKTAISAYRGSTNKFSKPFISNQAGTVATGNLSFIINRPTKEYSCIQDNRIIYTFKNLIPGDCLYLALAVYNEDKAKVKLEILDAYNYTGFSEHIPKFD